MVDSAGQTGTLRPVTPPVPRRSPEPEARQRDAERTRQALLDAALQEFAAKGLAGARVSEIAERAGVNKQLISYYFGGKDGLYQALVERWYEQEEQIADDDIPLEDLVARYLELGFRQPELMRVFLRETLDESAASEHEPEADDLASVRRRQQAGQIADELDPAFVLLVLQSAVASWLVFPGEVRRLMGLDPDSDAFRRHMEDQLRRLVRRLA